MAERSNEVPEEVVPIPTPVQPAEPATEPKVPESSTDSISQPVAVEPEPGVESTPDPEESESLADPSAADPSTADLLAADPLAVDPSTADPSDADQSLSEEVPVSSSPTNETTETQS